jgi:malto-oligosyltrehalose trehalohydrolase
LLDLAGARHPMTRERDGTWRLTRLADTDAPYSFVVDGQPTPDPLARAQAGDDVLGPSRLVDPRRHAWTSEWRGRPWEEAVVYELHIGTFTPEGTFAAAARRMPDLAALRITALEIMPVAHGPGMRGWGYDGCLLAAPHPAYGSPKDMKRFVEAAQASGIMVLLDVVLNHFAPQDSDMHRIAPAFFDPGRSSPWGAGIDYDKAPVRAFMRDVVLGWLTEYRLDGLRFDAIHEMGEGADTQMMAEIGRAVRALDFGRPIHLVNEDARNRPTLIRDGLSTAQWADDFHHAMHPLLTGEAWGYLRDFADDPVAKLQHALAEGFAKPGDGAPPVERGLPVFGLPTTAFVCHMQNHDQIGNRPDGARLISLVPEERAVEVAHALLLTSPFVPMLFMGEEDGERTPFHFFCDVDEGLAEAIRKGRKEQFGAMFERDDFPDPNDIATFQASKPFRQGDTEHARHWRELTRHLLALRHERIVPLLKSGRAAPAEVSRRGESALSVTWSFRDGFIVTHLNLGGPPDEPPAVTTPNDFALGDIGSDPYAIAVIVSRP